MTVALFYYPHTAVAAECLTVRHEQIAQNVLVFARLSFAPSDTQ